MEQRQLTFLEAIKKCLQDNYCNFNGRAARSEFWWFILFGLCVNIILGLVFGNGTVGQVVSGIVGLALLLPNIGVGVRRLHDIDKSGWWYLLIIVPVVDLLLIYWWAQPSQMTPNQYGAVPNM